MSTKRRAETLLLLHTQGKLKTMPWVLVARQRAQIKIKKQYALHRGKETDTVGADQLDLQSVRSGPSLADLTVWMAEPLLLRTPARADAVGQGCIGRQRVMAILGQALMAEAYGVTKVEKCASWTLTPGCLLIDDHRTSGGASLVSRWSEMEPKVSLAVVAVPWCLPLRLEEWSSAAASFVSSLASIYLVRTS